MISGESLSLNTEGVLISEEMATKVYEKENPIGKIYISVKVTKAQLLLHILPSGLS